MNNQWCLIVFLLVPNLSALYEQENIDFQIEKHNGTYDKTLVFDIDRNTQHIILFEPKNTVFPYTVIVESDEAKTDHPILVVVRKESEVLSWEVPLSVDTTLRDNTLLFSKTSRTVCHDDLKTILRHYSTLINPNGTPLKSANLLQSDLFQYFVVVLSTSSAPLVEVRLRVEEQRNFYIAENLTYNLTVSPSQPRYVMYKFEQDDSDTVIIEIDSTDNVCLTVSVQNVTCPVLDLNKDIKYEGLYQTINHKGAITIDKAKFTTGFFLVFVAKPDNYDCSQENSILPVPHHQGIIPDNRTSYVSFKIMKSINGSDYVFAIEITLVSVAVFSIVTALLEFLFAKFGTQSNCVKTDSCPVTSELYDENQPVSREEIERYLVEDKLTVKCLAKFPKKDKKRSFNYLWHILSIAIFYSIPVVQLVITYQRVVNQTGNQDMCYYNFMCAHPIGSLSDFNHVFSNIAYCLIGVQILLIVVYRHLTAPIRYELGIPVHYGLFYAMGIALIIEGILSACYHICPSQSNYQFDTSFMYIMAVLCMVKLYQNRHPDINATAYATFTVLGIAIFIAMIGILNGSLTVWIVFAVLYSMLCVYISFKIYFLSFIVEGFLKMKEDYADFGFTPVVFAPVKRGRFVLLLCANIINCAILVVGLCLYDRGITDFGTFLLGLLMANAVLHASFYTLMKLVNKERICYEAILYGLLMVATWSAATVFFLDAATLWTVTPAQSRQWNEECILLKFYDKHDIWHLLSAPALYFTFMYLLCLDDDLHDKPQNEIVVF